MWWVLAAGLALDAAGVRYSVDTIDMSDLDAIAVEGHGSAAVVIGECKPLASGTQSWSSPARVDSPTMLLVCRS